MKSNHMLRQAIHQALFCGALAAGASYVPTVQAQANDDEGVEEVVVTGSRILRQDYQSASPISTVDAATFQETGAPTIETVLNTLPQVIPSVTSTSNNPANGGQANIDLRGLGTRRTLVLLDGRRIVPSNPTGVVDLNLIPASVIKDVEIITGGASAAYGSDAIAGVVNIRTRDFVGLELNANYGETSESDGATDTLGISYGVESDDGRSHAFITYSHSERDPVTQGDRAFSEVSLDWNGTEFLPLGSSTIRQGRWDALNSNLPSQAAIDAYFATQDPGYVPGSAAPGNNYGFNPDGSLFNTLPVINFRGDTAEPLQPVNPDQYTYNYAPPNYLQLPLERDSFFGRASFDISDSTTIFAQFTWADYDAERALAPTPMTGVYIAADNPNIPTDLATLLASRPDPDAPFRFRKRMIEAGPRISNTAYEVSQFVTGIQGDLSFADGWSWDAYASVGDVEAEIQQLGNVSRSAFESLTLSDDHGLAACGGINPFGIGSISPECASFISRSATNNEQIKQTVIEAFVRGPLFDMPAGEVQSVFGVMYKKDDYDFIPDASLTQTSIDPVTGSSRTDIVGFNAADVVRGETKSDELYGEINFPLLSDAPAVQSLDFTLGYRFADHSVAGNMNSYKGEFFWRIDDSWSVRGGYQHALRAPNISELFRPATINFPGVGLGDPCSNNFNDPDGVVQGAQTNPNARALCIAQGIPESAIDAYSFTNTQFQGLSGGNPDLFEETADTYTLGFVFSPSGGALDGLQASVDYYSVEIEDVIQAIDADVFVERCYNQAFNPSLSPDNVFCSLFSRDAGTGTIIDALEVDQNLAARELEGIDFQVEYGFQAGSGDIRLSFLASKLLNWEEAQFQGEDLVDFAGTARGDIGETLPEWKWTTSVGYAIGDFDTSLRWRYIDDVRDANFPDFELDSQDYLTLTAGYNFSQYVDGLSVRVGVNNLTDEDPIIYPSQQQSNTDPSTYDTLGRRYFLSAIYRFQ